MAGPDSQMHRNGGRAGQVKVNQTHRGKSQQNTAGPLPPSSLGLRSLSPGRARAGRGGQDAWGTVFKVKLGLGGGPWGKTATLNPPASRWFLPCFPHLAQPPLSKAPGAVGTLCRPGERFVSKAPVCLHGSFLVLRGLGTCSGMASTGTPSWSVGMSKARVPTWGRHVPVPA